MNKSGSCFNRNNDGYCRFSGFLGSERYSSWFEHSWVLYDRSCDWSSNWPRPLNLSTSTHVYLDVGIVLFRHILLFLWRYTVVSRVSTVKHSLWFWSAWALTCDINSICLYKSCYIGPLKPLKCDTWAWALAWGTMINTRA